MWTIIGGVFEAVGLLVTGWGIRQTWVGATDERFLAPVVSRAASLRSRARLLVDRMRGRPRNQTILPGDAAVSVEVALRGSARVQFAALDRTAPLEDQITFLDTQLRDLFARMQDGDERDVVAVRAAEENVERVAADVQQVRDSLSALEVRLTLHGLRTEAFGLGLVGVGLLLQLVGSVVS